jgi:hypothetical protein
MSAGTKIGEPLPYYKRGEEHWPQVWRLPDQDDDQADLVDKITWLTDDIVLREAVHILDNTMCMPGSAQGVLVGLVGAAARLVAGSETLLVASDEGLADAVRSGFISLLRQYRSVNRVGWDALREGKICRICGCTEDRACAPPAGPCAWVEPGLCSNPACVAAEEATR